MIRVFTSKTQALGKEGEDIAAKWLVTQGFTVFERNISNKFGEIDIVARKGKIYYFFEVKTARGGSWFNPAENLTPAKLRKFVISCEYYALTHHIEEYRIHGILVTMGSQSPKVEIIDIS